jgi:hypothetical protein
LWIQKWVLHGFEEGQTSPPRGTPMTDQGNNKKAPMKEADWNPQEVQKEEEKRSEKHKVIK